MLLVLYSLGIVVILIIIILKKNSAFSFFDSPFLYGYTFFVTVFRISRVWAAIAYGHAEDKSFKRYKKNYTPDISFVIPCKNEEAAIEKTITKCFDAEYPKEKIEVIVVNDGSTDNTLAILEVLKHKFVGLTVVNWKDNRGKRQGMAKGFRLAKGEIVIQLDSDSYIEPETVKDFVRYFQDPNVGAVCAHAFIENSDENWITKMQTAHYYVAFRISKAAESVFSLIFCCSGCSSAYRKSFVIPVIDQWLGEKFLGLPVTWGDDRALTNWIMRQGYQTLYTHRARSFTIAPSTWKKFIKQQIRWKKGWFVNSLFASKFILQRDTFVALTYFFPLFITTFVSPFIAVKVFVIDWLFFGISPFYYVIGAASVAMFFLVCYRLLNPGDKYWLYLFVWAFVNMVFLSYILFWALATIRNRGWGTR